MSPISIMMPVSFSLCTLSSVNIFEGAVVLSSGRLQKNCRFVSQPQIHNLSYQIVVCNFEQINLITPILPTSQHLEVRCTFVSQKPLTNFLVSVRIHLCTIPYNTGLSGKTLKARGCRCEQQLSDHPKIFVNIFFGGNYVVKESGDFCPGLQRRHIYLTQRKSVPRIPSKVQKEICRVN